MAIEIKVPRLGWSMEEGGFVAWLKKDGEQVNAGEPLFSIEGDKAVQEIESIDSGILRIASNAPKPGEPVRVGDVLGHLLDAKAGTSTTATSKPASEKPKSIKSTPEAASAASSQTKAAPAPVTPPAEKQSIRKAISPRAARVAAELGVDWSQITGSGRTGRIRERDILAAATKRTFTPRAPRGSVQGPSTPHAVFFGELLMRLETQSYERFVQAREFVVRYTGAEANAGVSLRNFGLEASVVSAVPDTELGQACINYLRQYGLHMEGVLRCGSRLGTYFLEAGTPPRPSKVIYDRAGSAFSELKPGQINWDAALDGKQWFHWTGTAPALGAQLPAVVAEACAAAKRLGLKISCDLNYRSTLWNVERARAVLIPLMRHVDVLIGNEEHMALLLGDPAASKGPVLKGSGLERSQTIAQTLRSQYPFSDIAVTVREGGEDAPDRWRGLLHTEHGQFVSRSYPTPHIDRIGAGDAFSGALLYAFLTSMPSAEAIEFAAAAGSLKHTVRGDFNHVSREEVLALVGGDSGRRVQR